MAMLKVWKALVVITIISIIYYANRTDNHSKIYIAVPDKDSELVLEYFERRKNLELSELGKILFNGSIHPIADKRHYTILIWKKGLFLERRHIKSFTQNRRDPFENCSVKNCKLTYDDSDLTKSDAVVVHLHTLKNLEELPTSIERRPEQRWIFLTDESPYHTFQHKINWKDLSNVFNWSMTYKMESDVPVPYGRTVPLKNPTAEINIAELVPYYNEKDATTLATIMISNCGGKNKRMTYINEMKKHMKLDIYGSCGDSLKSACPGHFGADCPLLNKYLFYLVFENSNCDQYTTEKVFWNAYSKGAIPIIMGPSKESCQLVLPPGSYIHVEDYAAPVDLTRHLKQINDTRGENFFRYHRWRQYFAILNEHGYFNTKSVHYCRICEALNYNAKDTKIYRDLSAYLSPELNCH